jgi:hypothetical protein
MAPETQVLSAGPLVLVSLNLALGSGNWDLGYWPLDLGYAKQERGSTVLGNGKGSFPKLAFFVFVRRQSRIIPPGAIYFGELVNRTTVRNHLTPKKPSP